jgi:hypothetical protein
MICNLQEENKTNVQYIDSTSGSLFTNRKKKDAWKDEVETENFLKDMIPYANTKFDISEYTTDHISSMLSELNKKRLTQVQR